MTAKIRWFLARLNANYWFYPALFSLLAAVLAFTLVYLDRAGFAEWLNEVEWLVPARPDGASNMLTVIAAAMIGVASTVFSITIVAVSYASGTYGPRLLTNFMEDKGNQLSLATFIGSFVYAVTVLRSVRAEDEVAPSVADAAATSLPGFVPQISLLVAYALMAISVAVLVYFLNHIPASIRINSVLEDIGRRLIEDIRERYPEDDPEPGEDPGDDGEAVCSAHTGYVQIVDFEGLARLARERSLLLALAVRTGDFVHPGMALAHVVEGAVDDEDRAQIMEGFQLGATRTPKQDPQFLIDELVEIALRALSPGINDPFTAITAIHWLGAATAELGRRDLRKRVGTIEDVQRVFPLPDGFDHFIGRGFGAVRSAIATSPIAALVMLDTLRHAALAIVDADRRALLRRQGTRLLEQAREELTGPALEDVERRYAAFTKELKA